MHTCSFSVCLFLLVRLLALVDAKMTLKPNKLMFGVGGVLVQMLMMMGCSNAQEMSIETMTPTPSPIAPSPSHTPSTTPAPRSAQDVPGIFGNLAAPNQFFFWTAFLAFFVILFSHSGSRFLARGISMALNFTLLWKQGGMY